MAEYPIDQCQTCDRYDQDNMRQKNKLYCMFGCDTFQNYQLQMAFQYNRAVSGDCFDTKEMYEHGKKVFGSGWKYDKRRSDRKSYTRYQME